MARAFMNLEIVVTGTMDVGAAEEALAGAEVEAEAEIEA